MKTFSDLFRTMMQIGYVTDDLDAAVTYFQSTLGTGKCRVTYKSSLEGVIVDGHVTQEWVIDVAMVNAGATNLEIIQPVSGAVDLYRSAIRPGVPATFHHLGFRVDDFEQAAAIVVAHGKQWAQVGTMVGALHFGYIDMTAELGHYVEVMELQEGGLSFFSWLEAQSNKP